MTKRARFSKTLRYQPRGITEDEQKFFATKGTVFRELWTKKIRKGLNATESDRLDQMVYEFVRGQQQWETPERPENGV